jgi:hypothetical protein
MIKNLIIDVLTIPLIIGLQRTFSMKLFLPTLSLISIALFSAASHSQESKHTIGIDVSSSSGEYKSSSKDGDGFAQSYLFYNFQAFEHISFEAGYIGASQIDDWRCEEQSKDHWTCEFENDNKMFSLIADDFSLDGFVVAVKGDYPISKRNSFYGKIGAQYYNYDFSFNNRTIEEDSGVGVFVEAGWQYRWDMGIGMNVGMRYQDLGDLTLKSPTIGITYSF